MALLWQRPGNIRFNCAGKLLYSYKLHISIIPSPSLPPPSLIPHPSSLIPSLFHPSPPPSFSSSLPSIHLPSPLSLPGRRKLPWIEYTRTSWELDEQPGRALFASLYKFYSSPKSAWSSTNLSKFYFWHRGIFRCRLWILGLRRIRWRDLGGEHYQH